MRKPRTLRAGASYHVMARANRSEFILDSPLIKQIFLETVARARKRYKVALSNICIMDNHFHLMLRPLGSTALSRVMQWILSVFAMKFNRTMGLRGHVWYDRFKSVLIASLRQFLAAFGYIDDNPVEAGIVSRPEDYPYGRQRLASTGPPGILDPAGILEWLLFPMTRTADLPSPGVQD